MEEATGIFQNKQMKRAATILLSLVFLVPARNHAQSAKKQTGFWRISSYSGEIRANWFYRLQERKGNQIYEKQESDLLSAGILLRTNSYIWHPRFLTIDINGEYTPTQTKDKYLVIPDEAENRDMRRFDVAFTLLPQNKFSISSYINYGRVYNSRESLTSILSNSKNWGSTLFLRANKIPFSIGYNSWNLDEKEIQTNRRFQNKQNNLEGRFNTSFGKNDKQDLVVTHSEFFRKDYSKTETFNKINNLSYNSHVLFGVKKRDNMSTLFSGTWQNGNDTFTRYQFLENINCELKNNFSLGTNYSFFSDQRFLQTLNQHKAGAYIRHHLFESLYSQLSYDYTTASHTMYKQSLQQGSVDLKYSKKILKKHDLELAYRYNLQQQHWQSDDGIIPVINEILQLKDGQITLLSRPYITVSTVRIKDVTGTIIYQANLDYIIIPQNNFLQVQRVPGGQIANNATVYVDYTAIQPGNYDYTGTNYYLSAGLSFFNRFLGFYYHRSVQDYQDLKKADFLTLNYFQNNVFGVRLEYKYLTGGVEYDDMNSHVLPYKLLRYFINLQGTLKKKIAVSVNGNVYDYKELGDVKNLQFADVSLNAVWQLSKKLSLKSSFNYRKQTGEGVGLDLLNFKTGFNADIKRLRFSVDYNYYDRSIFTSEKIRFNAVNIQLARKF